LLRRNAVFRRLWLARAVSFIGDGIALLALLLLVKERQESGVAVAGLLLAHSVPRALGPVVGALSDRMDQKRLMIACDLGQAVLFAAIALLSPSYAALLFLVAAASVLATTFSPAGRSAVPALVHTDDLLAANAWLGLALNFQIAVGPALGGFLVAVAGTSGAIGTNSATFVVSAALLGKLPPLPPHAETNGAPERLLASVQSGLAFARRHSVVRTLALTLLMGVAFAGMDNVALIFLARDEFGLGPLGVGLLTSAFGIGMVAASVALLQSRPRVDPMSLFVVGWVLTGLGGLLTGLAPVAGIAFGVQAVAGIGNGIENVASDTLIQRTVERPLLGRVFGLTSTAAFLGGAVAYAAGGLLLEVTTARSVFLIAGSGTLLAVLLGRFVMARWGF
jgi:MFS family permease